MHNPARDRRAPSPAARVGYVIARGLLAASLILGALILSVIASVRGFTAALVAAAVIALVALRAHNQQHPARRPAGARSVKAFAIAAAVVVGFFVLLTVASQVWPR